MQFDSPELAMAVAAEWDAQDTSKGIEPAVMPLMSLASTAIDQVRGGRGFGMKGGSVSGVCCVVLEGPMLFVVGGCYVVLCVCVRACVFSCLASTEQIDGTNVQASVVAGRCVHVRVCFLIFHRPR